MPILKTLTEEEILKAADALAPTTFEAGTTIITEGEYGDKFFIIEDGTVSIQSKKEGKKLAKKERGEYFGGPCATLSFSQTLPLHAQVYFLFLFLEIALLTDGYRVASVIAETPVDCLILDKAAFDRLLGRAVDILKRNMEVYSHYESQVEDDE